MISNLLKSRQAARQALIINNARRNFAALSLQSKGSDVHSASVAEVGSLMQQIAQNESSANQSEGELYDAIDEYFRQKFRKVSFSDAKNIMVGLGAKEGQELNVHKIQGLDDKFWVWETLEEASRPQVDELSKDELHSYFRAWAA